MIKVSVIIPTYGIPTFLQKSIDSVLNQSLDDIELIVVDDNSPESEGRKKTQALIQNYRGKLKYIQHEKNKNGAAARNTGIREAQGKYIAFLDSDDEYDVDRLLKCYTAIEKLDDSYGAVYTGCSFYRKNEPYRNFKNVKTGNFLLETLACEFSFCTGSNIFMKASIVRELNGFDESFLRHQDYEFLVRFFEHYSIYSIPELLVKKNDEFLNLPNVDKVIMIKQQYLKKYAYIIDKLPIQEKKYVYGSQYYQIAQLALECKNYHVFRNYYRLCRDEMRVSLVKKLRLLAIWIRNLG